MWRSAEARRSAPTRQDAQVHPSGRGQVFHRANSHNRGSTLPSRCSRTYSTQEKVGDQETRGRDCSRKQQTKLR
jgi:hypothetical protein